MLKKIMHELEEHLPFTAFGALTGIALMLVTKNIPYDTAYKIFYTLHPTHVILSAFITSSMYALNRGKRNFITVLLIGYFGSIGVATLSDSIIPFWCEKLLGMPNTEAHIGFIEEWMIVNPSALLGIVLAYFIPSTKFPHALHILVSTWASLFHITMAMNGAPTGLISYVFVFLFLIVSVWIPCCTSDIIFPLLFTGKMPEGHHHG